MNRKDTRLVFAFAAAASILLVLRMAGVFFTQPSADLISWDQASRAQGAVRLAKDLRFFEFSRFAVHLLAFNWWPPLHPLIMVPFVFILGPNLKGAVVPSLIAYVLTILSILFCYSGLSLGSLREKSVGFALAFGLATTSPFLLSSGTWAMLEIFGVGLTYLGFGAYFRARRTGQIGFAKTCAVALFLLWLLKYYYGICFVFVLSFLEIQRSWPVLRSRLVPLSIARTRRALLKPIFFPIYGFLMLIAWILFTGGVKGKVLGVFINATQIYNPAHFIYLYALLLLVLAIRKNRKKIERCLAAGQRELFFWGVLPVALFMALPDKIRALFRNFEGSQRVASTPFLDRAHFYLSSFLQEYSLFVGVGVIVAALVVLAVLRVRKAPLGLHALGLLGLLGGISLGFGFNFVESRFLATFIPALWVTAAWAANAVTAKLLPPIRSAFAGAIVLVALIVLFLTPLVIQRAIKQPWASWAHYEESARAPIENIVEMSRGTSSVFVAGARDTGFGPLLGWRIQAAHFGDKGFNAALDDVGPFRIGTAEFQKMLTGETMDLFVLCFAGIEKEDRLRLDWARLLRDSGKYRLERKVRFELGHPLALEFYKKIVRLKEEPLRLFFLP